MEEEEELFNDTLFRDNGRPLRFYLHPSIKQPGARLALEAKIETHGGEINLDKSGSDVILVNPNVPSGNVDDLRHLYKTHSDPSLKGVHVETMKWVENSVRMGKCVHLFSQKRMGGVAAGGFRERTEFSAEDDRRLCDYVGTLVPDKTNGGRTGNNIYKMLMRNAELDPEEYDWVLRHTWHSWRERYKKNQPRFDEYINKYVVPLGIEPHRQYHLSRKAPRGSKRGADDMDSAEEEEEEEEEDGLVAPPSRKRRVSGPGRSQPDAKRQRRSVSLPDVEVARSPSREASPPYDGDGFSLFGPDPEPSQHTPPPANVRLPTSRVRSSQATLVGTAPTQGASTSAKSRPSPQEAPPRRQQPARPRMAARPAVPRARKRKPAPAPELIEAPAPYRLRSRSNSVGPATYVDDINAITRKKGKKELEPVDEDEENGMGFRPQGTVETQEEQNVEELLMAATLSGVSEGGGAGDEFEEVEQAVSMPPPRKARPQRRPSLETDDGQTHNVLQGAVSMAPPRQVGRQNARRPSFETDDGQTDSALRRVSFSPAPRSSVARNFGTKQTREVLHDLVGARLSRPPESTTSKAGSSPRLAQNSPPDGFSGSARRSYQAPSIDLHNPLYTHSVGRASVSRKDSVSSGDSFPFDHTRARALKREIKANEKHTPYRPPAGTRAAALSR